MTKNMLAAAMVAAFGLSGLGTTVLAQEGPNDAAVIEEIMVTATKRTESIYDVPLAISAFTAEGIERAGIGDLVDIGKFVPNLNVTEFSAGHTSSVNPFIRGIGLQDHLITTDPGVSVYVDGFTWVARWDRTGASPISSASKCCAVRRVRCTAETRLAARSISSRQSQARMKAAAYR